MRLSMRCVVGLSALVLATTAPMSFGQPALPTEPTPPSLALGSDGEDNEVTADASATERQALMDLERRSHRWWLDGDTEALAELMTDDYRLVAPNGAVETKAWVTGADPDSVRMLQVESMTVSPQEVILDDDRAIVIAVIEMDATVAGRPAPGRLRVLSVFEREDAAAPWRLLARAMTPVRTPPRTESE